MRTGSDSRGGTDLDVIAHTRRQIRELKDARTLRERLIRGTPEHDAALAAEQQLQSRFWRWARGAGDGKS